MLLSQDRPDRFEQTMSVGGHRVEEFRDQVATYDESVFVNCPFDEDYRQIREALYFAVADCGFAVRSASEQDDGAVRLEKILRLIGESRLGIHDLSRTEPDGGSKLPRFNMPFELGLFHGARHFGSTDHDSKAYVILVKEDFRHQVYISDLAGIDARNHNLTVKGVIGVIRDWLSHHLPAPVVLPGVDLLVERYERFRAHLPAMCAPKKLDPDLLIHINYLRYVSAWIANDPWDEFEP